MVQYALSVTDPDRRHPPAWRDGAVLLKPVRNLLSLIVPDEPPLELQIVGRTLLHAALVGLCAGIVGTAFVVALFRGQDYFLGQLAGYTKMTTPPEQVPHYFRWYLLILLPSAGGILCGLLTRKAPEARGGGGDAAIQAFHGRNGDVPARVLWVKPFSALATLGTGGSGGREGPAMQIGAAIGSLVGRTLSLSDREKRVLMVAGISAGMAAIFRTPLGAALLSIEVLYKDDFEAEALIPAVLSSVIAYSVSLSVFGTEPLFGDVPHFPFLPRQLPLYIGLALVVSVGASLFETTMHHVQTAFAKLKGPDWLRPAAGGLALGALVVIVSYTLDPWIGNGHGGLGLLGGGYDAGAAVIRFPHWMRPGWTTVELLVVLAVVKIFATALTIGSGGSAGDFAPSIAIGGIIGGAYGLAAQLVFNDPRIQPAAFALVGMAAFYGGLAKVPLAALVMVCEVAGSYDLLVPLMFSEGVAMIALRRVSLYRSQPRTMRDSPVHAGALSLRCGDVVARDRRVVVLRLRQSIHEVADAVENAPDQDVFPVLDDNDKVAGLLAAESLRTFVVDGAAIDVAIVADAMVPPLTFTERDDVRSAALQLVRRDVRAAPVLDPNGRILGMLDQQDIVRAITAGAGSPGESHA